MFSASPDQTIRVWGIQHRACGQVIRAHDGPVTGLSLHATGDYLLSTSTDGNWAFSDLRVGRVLTKVADNTAQSGKSLFFNFLLSTESTPRVSMQ